MYYHAWDVAGDKLFRMLDVALLGSVPILKVHITVYMAVWVGSDIVFSYFY